MADVEALTGARVTYGALYDNIKTFFDEGGESAYIARVVGPAATKGTLTLVDRDPTTPANTLRIDAQNAGSWSTNLTIQVLDGSLSNTFRIVVRLGSDIVEDKNNLATPADAVLAFASSKYVRAVDLGSVTAAPNNIPAVAAAAALSAGSDDRASITTTHYINALALFLKGLGDGAVAIPGQNGSTIWNAINTHCKTFNRIGLLADARTATVNQIITDASGINSEYCGMFAPWIKISDGAGGSRTVSPEGYVAACRSRAHQEVGPWRVPAGQIAVANTLIDVDVAYTGDQGAQLNDGRVNAIRTIANSIRLYGWRSTSSDVRSYYHLKDRDFLNYLVVSGEALLEQFVFNTIDQKGQLLSSINGALVGMMLPLAQANAVFPQVDGGGNEVDPGYQVDTGGSVNTLATMASNEVRAKLAVRISPVGELITLNIVKADLLDGLS
jgi:phage tail sheath protein FI